MIRMILCLLLLAPSLALAAGYASRSAHLLPTPFYVYVNNDVVVNHEVPGFKKVELPTNNDDLSDPGCYVACYSHGAGVYSVGGDIYVRGQVHVSGTYQGRVCRPTGFEKSDISKEAYFNALCSMKVNACTGHACWAGGDTGGWFGIL